MEHNWARLKDSFALGIWLLVELLLLTLINSRLAQFPFLSHNVTTTSFHTTTNNITPQVILAASIVWREIGKEKGFVAGIGRNRSQSHINNEKAHKNFCHSIWYDFSWWWANWQVYRILSALNTINGIVAGRHLKHNLIFRCWPIEFVAIRRMGNSTFRTDVCRRFRASLSTPHFILDRLARLQLASLSKQIKVSISCDTK